MLEGTPENPIATYGGDTVLALPKASENDAAMVKSVIQTVIDIYLEAGGRSDGDRASFIQYELASKFPGSI